MKDGMNEKRGHSTIGSKYIGGHSFGTQKQQMDVSAAPGGTSMHNPPKAKWMPCNKPLNKTKQTTRR